MNEYEQAWNDLIKRGFRNNPIFKDVLRELTKELQGCGWRCLEKLLIKKNVFNEAKLTEEHVSPRTLLIRALQYIVISSITGDAIRNGLASSINGNRYREVINKLDKMLPTEDCEGTYSSLDNDGLTDDSDNYSFVSTDANIAGVENGVLYCDIDGTCIILKQNKQDSTDRKYYKVRVKDKLIYDDSKSVVALDDGVFIVGGVEFKMIHVEGGTFTMGEGSGAHQVTLSSYYIGETQVTQALWEAVMGTNPSLFKGNDRPVERVSWNDCQDFIKELNAKTDKNFRLPTEAEWEYAARGGNQSEGHQYSGNDNLDEVAWYGGTEGTHPVGKKGANELDIYDMSGNVWEWCQDWYGENYYKESPQTNPTGPASGEHRVHRGGGWNSYAENCPLSFRRHDASDYVHLNLGFRLALSE